MKCITVHTTHICQKSELCVPMKMSTFKVESKQKSYVFPSSQCFPFIYLSSIIEPGFISIYYCCCCYYYSLFICCCCFNTTKLFYFFYLFVIDSRLVNLELFQISQRVFFVCALLFQ